MDWHTCSAKTYAVNYGVMLDFEWEHSPEIENIIAPSRFENTLVNVDGVMTQTKQPGRNEPYVFCGSGKKYKKCCLR
jgi:uncharacterized protein YchJ